MDSYIEQLKSIKKIGYTIIVLSVIALLFNRIFAFPFNWTLVAVAIIGLWVGIGIAGKSDENKYKYLKQSGQQITAKVLYISLQASPTQFGHKGTAPWQPPYLANFQIVCEGIDPTNNSKKIFVSDTLTYHPNLKISPDTVLKVYVNKNDSNIYWVDLSDVDLDSNFPGVSITLFQKTPTYRSYDGVSYKQVV